MAEMAGRESQDFSKSEHPNASRDNEQLASCRQYSTALDYSTMSFCSCSPVTKNNKSHSRASSMHLTRWLDHQLARRFADECVQIARTARRLRPPCCKWRWFGFASRKNT